MPSSFPNSDPILDQNTGTIISIDIFRPGAKFTKPSKIKMYLRYCFLTMTNNIVILTIAYSHVLLKNSNNILDTS